MATYTSAEAETNLYYFVVTPSLTSLLKEGATIDREAVIHPHSGVALRLHRACLNTALTVWEIPL